jgi:hypothetical protein
LAQRVSATADPSADPGNPAISAAIDGYRDKANVAAEQFTMGGQSDPYQ